MPIPMNKPDPLKHFKTTLTLPASNSLEENAEQLAQHYNETTASGHGIFFDFSLNKELEKPTLHILCSKYNWILEREADPPVDGFIRKQDSENN